MATEPVSNAEPSALLQEQDRFYHDRLGFILLLILVMGAIAGVLVMLILALQPLRSPPPVFFKASANAELIQEVPLNQPSMTTNVLFNWLIQGMISVHSFNFVNYAMHLEAAKAYFTPEGYDSFTGALKDTQILDQIISNKYVFRGMPTAAPQVIKEGVLADRYLWKIKFPMFFQYRNVTKSLSDTADLTVLVVRVPTNTSPYGIKVLQYEVSVRKGGGE